VLPLVHLVVLEDEGRQQFFAHDPRLTDSHLSRPSNPLHEDREYQQPP
jgi:hypothetical protein